MENYLTTKQAAKYLGVSETTLYAYLKQGKLKRYKLVRLNRFVKSDLDDFIKKNKE